MSAPDSSVSTSRLTHQQRAALTISGSSVALSAGAGCGKTSVLTGRYLALLQPPFSLKIDQIVALTFTEKAARELRDRVRRECLDRYATSDDKATWRRTLQGLESAHIGTFHAFCKELLQAHADEAQVDPSFEILDESLATNLRQEALTVCLRRWLSARNADLIKLAIDHGLSAIQEALADLLKKRPEIDFALWASRSPVEIVAIWETQVREKLLPILLHDLHHNHAALLDVLRENVCTHPKGEATRRMVLASLPTLSESSDISQALVDLRENAKVQGFGTVKNWPSAEVFGFVRDGYEALRKELKPILELARPDEGRSIPAAESALAFARLAEEAIIQFSAMKEDQGLLDFHDLQVRVRDLLRSNPNEICERLQRSIGMLLVDEFQDTDPLQSEILQTLAGPDPTLGRLFLVGDVKQSIYRFRGAQPALFETFRRQFPEDGRLSLSDNFRSVPGILSFVNMLFADTFVGDEHLLRPGTAPILTEPVSPPCVHFLWVDCDLEAASKRRAEAAKIASLIADRLEQGWWIRDRAAAGPRLATAGDVVLLFRSGTDFAIYEQALARVGLEYHVVGGATYFAQQEVIDLINLLTTLEDPLDALALAGTLRGPIFGVSDEALFWLATGGERDLPSALENWETLADSFSDRDRAAVVRAHRSLTRWRGWKDRVPIATLLDQCLSESGFEAALMGEFLGDRKRANVRKMVELARRFDRRGGYTLADFVAKLRADLKNPPREEQATTTDEDGEAVRLMTIHQAKGLEFPIVVVPDLDRGRPNTSDLFAYHEDLGVLIRGSGDDEDERPSVCLGRLLFDRLEKKAEKDEALRSLYVATTRARDVLILSSGRDSNTPPKSPAMKLIAERFDLTTGLPTSAPPGDSARPYVDVIDAGTLPDRPRRTRTRFRPSLLLTSRRILASHEDLDTFPHEKQAVPGFLDLDPHHQPASHDAQIRRLFLGLCLPHEGATSNPDRISKAARSQGVWITAADSVRIAAWLKAFSRSEFGSSLRVTDQLVYDREWFGETPVDASRSLGYRATIDIARRRTEGSWDIVKLVTTSDKRSLELARASLQLALEGPELPDLGPIAQGFLVMIEAESVKVEAVERLGPRLLQGVMLDLLSDE